MTPGVHRWSLAAFVESIQFIRHAHESSGRAAGAPRHVLVSLHVYGSFSALSSELSGFTLGS